MDDVFTPVNLTHALTAADFLVLGVAVALLFVIAWCVGRREQNTQDYFLGGRSVPAAVACLSFVATEISAITVISVPAVAYSENWMYIQMFFGSAAARLFIAFIFIPVFYKYSCTTIYEFLKHRFGPETQYAGSCCFFITRLVGSGVRLYVACLGIKVIMGCSLEQAVLFFTVVSVAFIGVGGIKAVVWNGAYQAVMFYVAGVAVAACLLAQIDGGLAAVWRMAGESHRLDWINTSLNFWDPKTVWAASLNAFFIGLSVFGTDQEFMQRMLTVKTRRASQSALVGTIAAGLPLLLLYLTLGTILFAFYKTHGGAPAIGKADEIMSYTVVHVLPAGIRGLVLAAIILASIDSPLMSLSSSFVTDIYRTLIVRGRDDAHYLRVSRCGVVLFGIVLMLLALGFAPIADKGLWLAFQVVSVTGGSTLGIFMLGVLTKRRSNHANVLAMVVSAMTCLSLLVLSKGGVVQLGWTWLIVLGAIETFVIAWLLGPLMEKDAAPPPV
jgi:SSS family transporter